MHLIFLLIPYAKVYIYTNGIKYRQLMQEDFAKMKKKGEIQMKTYENVRNRLLFLCGQKQITLGQLATSSGVPKSTVKNIIYGKSRNPGIVTIKSLCDGLGLSLFDFIDAPEFKTYEQEIE